MNEENNRPTNEQLDISDDFITSLEEIEQLRKRFKHRGGKFLWEKYPEMAVQWARSEAEARDSEEWKNHNMEYDMSQNSAIMKKVLDDRYAQNLYAALCNTEWQKLDVMPLLKNQRWYCTWRSAGGIVADMRKEGDYLDWYCSGMGDGLGNGDPQGEKGYVNEGTVTEEITQDLAAIGWYQVSGPKDER